MTQLLQRMRDELVRRNYAATTIRTYLHALDYQWESRQRSPSPVFWKRVEALGAIRLDSSRARIESNVPPKDLVDPLAIDSKEESAAHR